jgi:rare lipoprotein A (RlpA)-like double-psi beta-barrel protein/surface rod structure-forming protein G/uncharacterized protein DUF348
LLGSAGFRQRGAVVWTASLPAASPPDGVDMWMKVRRGGYSALVLFAAGSLLNTSTSLGAPLLLQGRTLNLRIPKSSAADLSGESVAVWVLSGPQGLAMRGVHAVAGEGVAMGTATPHAGQVVSIPVTVGRQPQMRVLTNAEAVSDLLSALGIDLGPRDEVRPSLDRALGPATRVSVVRVHRFRRTDTVTLPYRTLIQYSKELPAGQVSVISAGAVGRASVTYLITIRNGRESSREVMARTTLAQPVDRVEEHSIAAPNPSHGAESGDASWYDWSGCGSGYHAAHRTLPFGTVVTIRNIDNGRTVAVTINDRGPYLPGRIIDLCPTAFSALAPLGQGIAYVEITW